MLALVDGDIVAWKAAATTERTEYDVGGEHFRYKKEALAYAEDEGLEVDTISPVTVTEPLELTFRNVDSLMKSIMDGSGADTAVVYLTGKGNYRETIAVTRPYKGNRTKTPPSTLAPAKAYLTEHYGAETIHGAEADDAMGCQLVAANATRWSSILSGAELDKHAAIICTTDKDLKMIPGLHYHLDRQDITEVTEEESWSTFYHQLLVGDSTDNIPGLSGCGKVSAKRILEDCETKEELHAATLQAYQNLLGDEEGERMFLEQGDLIWIQRHEGRLFSEDF